MRNKIYIAPIFEHGEGVSSSYPYVSFACIEQEDAFNIIKTFFLSNDLSLNKINISPLPFERYQAIKAPQLFKENEAYHSHELKEYRAPVYRKNQLLNNLVYRKRKNKKWYYNKNPFHLFSRYINIPLFIDFYCKELNLVIKYITKIDCQIYDEDCSDGNLNEIYDCKKNAIRIREFLHNKSIVNGTVFYDPSLQFDFVEENQEDVYSKSKELLKAQVSDFFKWLKQNEILRKDS